MSYDIDLEIDTGGPERHIVQEFNITYNVAAMLNRALDGWPGNKYPGTQSEVHSFQHLHGWKAGAAYVPLLIAYYFLTDPNNETELRSLEPTNNWGTLEQLITFLDLLLESLKAHPKTSLNVY